MLAKFSAFFLRSPLAAMSSGLAAIAIVGWIVGSWSGADPASLTLDSGRLDVPVWEPFAANDARQRAADTHLFAVNPDDVVAPAAAVADPEPNAMREGGWRFMGTIMRADTLMAVIVLDGTNKSQLVGTGDLLPNGEKIADVGPESLAYEHEESRREMRLFERIEK